MAAVLIIDDSMCHRGEVRKALEEGGGYDRIIEAADGINGLYRLISESPDIVICDLEMPGLDGEELLQIVKSNPLTRDVPFLFATASTDADRRVRLLETGAQDVILKPFHPRELMARLQLHLKLKQLQDERVEYVERLELLSTMDQLTGLRNRRYLDETLEVAFRRARRHNTPLSILMVDLDNFKHINDAYGHPAGDAVLSQAGRRIRGFTRITDVSARYGGEEFLSVLEHSDTQQALVAAEHWRSGLADQPFEIPCGKSIAVTASIGVATYEAELASVAALVAAADEALYRAKSQGRDCVVHAAFPDAVM